jgi:hypothetical protein
MQMNMQMMMQTMGLTPPGGMVGGGTGAAVAGGVGALPAVPMGGGMLGTGVDQFQQQIHQQLNPLPKTF